MQCIFGKSPAQAAPIRHGGLKHRHDGAVNPKRCGPKGRILARAMAQISQVIRGPGIPASHQSLSRWRGERLTELTRIGRPR